MTRPRGFAGPPTQSRGSLDMLLRRVANEVRDNGRADTRRLHRRTLWSAVTRGWVRRFGRENRWCELTADGRAQIGAPPAEEPLPAALDDAGPADAGATAEE